LNPRVKLVRDIVREVCGWAPYEKRVMEILKGGGNNPSKRAQKFAKKRLGTHGRAKRKVEELGKVIAEVKRKEAAQKSGEKKAKKGKETKKDVVKKSLRKKHKELKRKPLLQLKKKQVKKKPKKKLPLKKKKLQKKLQQRKKKKLLLRKRLLRRKRLKLRKKLLRKKRLRVVRKKNPQKEVKNPRKRKRINDAFCVNKRHVNLFQCSEKNEMYIMFSNNYLPFNFTYFLCLICRLDFTDSRNSCNWL